MAAALLVAGAVAAYLVGMNTFLQTRLFRDAISAAPGSLLVEYTRAYSIVPGRIHVEGLRIRGRDSSVEWILVIDQCDFRVSFPELMHKRFHASNVSADGLSLRLRLRKDAITSEEMQAIPPVPGLLDPPLRDVGPPPAPLTDENYHLWSIRLDGVDVRHVREIWIDTIRYAGDLEIRGRWFFRPLRWLEIGPANVDLHPLDVSFGRIEPWASGVVGAIDVTVHPFHLQRVRGIAILDQISTDGAFHGTIRAANPLDRIIYNARVVSADAPLDARVRIDHGVVRPGTVVTSEPFDARVSHGDLAFGAILSADVRVGEGGRGVATVTLSSLRASQREYTRAQAARIVTVLASGALDLAHPFSDATWAVDVEDAQTESLRFWRARVPGAGDVSVDSGVATASGHVGGRVTDETVRGHLTMGVRDFVLQRGAIRISAPELSLEATDARATILARTFAGALDVRADGVSVEAKGAKARANLVAQAIVRRGLWRESRIEGTGTVSLRRVGATAMGVHAVIPALEARADGSIVAGRGFLGEVSVDAPDIEVPSIAEVGRLLSLPAFLTIERGSAHATVRAAFDVGQAAGTAVAQVEVRDLRAHVGAETLDGVLRAAVHAKKTRQSFDLAGSTIAFDGAPGAGATGWWGRVELREAALRLAGAPRLEALVAARAQDASPVAALIKSAARIPGWAVDAVSKNAFEASADLVVAPSTFEARSVTARAEGVDAALEYARLGPDKEWALFLDLGLLHAGVHVKNGASEVVLFGVKPWFERHVASLRAAERKNE